MEDLLRSLTPSVLGVLVRRYGSIDACEDAVQDALLAAAMQWPKQGIPDNPSAWLITVGARRLIDARRSEAARHQREAVVAALVPTDELLSPAPEDLRPEGDDTLTLLLLCCHPELSPSSRMALTLRAVGGLTTEQIASAFLVSEATMSQRISRAKQRLKATGATFAMPPDPTERMRTVLHVLYLIFNEGYTSTSGPDLQRTSLTGEAIRLTREVHRLLPTDGEVAGLLALMLLTEARRPARTGPDGVLIPLAEQDRTRWNREQIDEGCALITRTLARAVLGPYQLQAAIAAVHDEAPRAEDTDWPQILVLYQLLDQAWPNPVVRLNQSIALAMVRGPQAGLELLATLDADERMANGHRLYAVRAHLLEMAGEVAAAYEAYEVAGRRTTSLPERRYLEARAQRLVRGDREQ
ncbi:sigma-70 family RNA polymerase sigma factor [Dactylosporangium sp. NPDC051484]|uniref:RNA polymerase sigma factor n=1 Tax=Dactylosporangium sp. NPDC051484 TaxID=3154942 RepID=UPI00344D0876